MYITINDIIGEKKTDLSYPSKNFDSSEIAVIAMFSDNILYEVEKAFKFIPPNSPGDKVLIESKTYAGRELISALGGVNGLTDLVDNDQVSKKNKLSGITEMIINSNEHDNTDNLEDRRPSNALFTYHVTDDDKDFTRFEPHNPQYKKLKNVEFTSLTLRIMDQVGNIITDGLRVTVVLHISDRKI